MAQTVSSITLLPGQKKNILEKPHILNRIFFSIQVVRAPGEWGALKVSFDDSHLYSYYVLDGSSRYFEARGKGIFQGNIWAQNVADFSLLITMTEILL